MSVSIRYSDFPLKDLLDKLFLYIDSNVCICVFGVLSITKLELYGWN
jgi:hypothetical protein